MIEKGKRPVTMKHLRIFLLSLWFLAALAGCPIRDPGDDHGDKDPLDEFFSLNLIHSVVIEADDATVKALLEEPREYAPASVEIDGTVHPEVAIRLKGNRSFRPLEGGQPDKPAFIVDFNRYIRDENHLGLQKLTLNNMVQDPSFIHEYLGYSLFRWGEVPASRSGYAQVTFNGDYKGLYALIESNDNDLFLERWFGSDDGNLYEGAGADFQESVWEDFDQDNGNDKSMQDIKDVVETLQTVDSGEDSYQTLEQFFDLEKYVTFATTELYLGHWDGYTIHINNYKVHHSLDNDVWTFIPWGIDQLFNDNKYKLGPHNGVMWSNNPPRWNTGGKVHQLCFWSEECRIMLHDEFIKLLNRVDEMDLIGLAEEARKLVEPLAIEEAIELGTPYKPSRYLDNVIAFIERRRKSIEMWLPCLVGGEVDNDGDGYDGCMMDCNDYSSKAYPGATELCNCYDDDCNGVVDDQPECFICLEAEQMSYHANGTQSGEYWLLWANGTMSENVDFPETRIYRFEIIARGELVNGIGPEMELIIDGVIKDRVFVNTTIPETFVFDIAVSEGIHEFAIGFYNDFYNPPEDRNLYVDKTTITLLN